jgi:MoaA/NifB/PqqE/SkfB family radical SAM enzyme
VPSSLAALRPDLEAFLARLKGLAPGLDIDLGRLSGFLDGATPAYVSNEGLPLAPNIRLKVKPFMYGRKLADYCPARHPVRCGNRILGVLADGSVVPCCLDYDGVLRLGDARTETLADILERSAPFLKSLRDRNAAKPPLCARCLGQPTLRGALACQALDRLSKA